MVLVSLYLIMIMRIIFAFVLFPLIFTSFAKAEEVNPWDDVYRVLDAGEEVVILPLQSEIHLDLQEQPPPPQPELQFGGANGEGGTSVAQAMLTLPPVSVGGQSAISPYFALKVQSDGTREGQSLSVEGGISLSIGERSQIQLSVETMVSPFPSTSIQGNVVFKF